MYNERFEFLNTLNVSSTKCMEKLDNIFDSMEKITGVGMCPSGLINNMVQRDSNGDSLKKKKIFFYLFEITAS